jgi:hypothetical protein
VEEYIPMERIVVFSVWNKGIVISLPQERVASMYKMEEKKNPPNSLGLFPSLRSRQKA